MRNLKDEILKGYNVRELLLLSERLINYIVPFSNSDIKWEVLDGFNMQRFFDENYYDAKKDDYVYWIDNFDKLPLGLYYLDFYQETSDSLYLVGSITNNISKRTIIGVICFRNDWLIGNNTNPVNFIDYVEINYFYQQHGLLDIMLKELSKYLLKNQALIVTEESRMGRVCHMMDHIKKVMRENNYDNDILFEYEINHEYIKKLTKVGLNNGKI